MATMIALALLSACSSPPTVSTDATFVGRLVDDAGEPLADVQVNSIEGQHHTDGDGRFAVPIQPPSKLVHFVLDDVYYQRVQRDADVGTLVEVALPPRAPRTATCPPMACAVSLGWRFDSALSAKVVPKCTPGATIELGSVPTAIPEGTCRAGAGREATVVPLAIDVDGETWAMREAGADFTVEVVDPVGGRVPDCEVTVGRNAAEASGDGTYVGRAHGPSTVTAICQGRAARPERVTPDPQGENQVTVQWAPAGPTVDLGAIAPWARFVVIRNETTAWELSAQVDDAGILALPALQAGQYTVYVRGAKGKAPVKSPEPIRAPDVLSFTEVGEQSWVGRLHLEHPVEDGAIRTHVAPPR